MNSAGSSAFWFYRNTPEWWTEIDVFEIGAGAPGFERKVNMNLHVFHTPSDPKHHEEHSEFTAPAGLADAFHVYGVQWDAHRIRFYFDGMQLRDSVNRVWHQPLTLNFDSETMGDWFGLPRDQDLPSFYDIDYVRSWKPAEHP